MGVRDSEQPKAGDKAAPQAPPNRNLRPNEDQAEQTKPRTVPEVPPRIRWSERRDGHEVIDWFPGDHPAMLPIIKNGPASLMAERGRAAARVTCQTAKGRPENAPPAGQPVAYTIQTLHDLRPACAWCRSAKSPTRTPCRRWPRR